MAPLPRASAAAAPRADDGERPRGRAGGGRSARGRGTDFSLRRRRSLAAPRPRCRPGFYFIYFIFFLSNGAGERPPPGSGRERRAFGPPVCDSCPPPRPARARRAPAPPQVRPGREAPYGLRAPLRPPRGLPTAPSPPTAGTGGRGRRGGPCRRFLAVPPTPPPRQDSAGSAEQPFSAAAAAPEPSRAARASGGTSRGVPAPRCRFRNGRPELRRVPPGPGGLRRGAGRDNPTLSPPFCYRAGVFPKQTQSGSLGNGPPLCRGGRCPQPGPGPPSPRGPAPVRTRPGTPGGSELLPTGIPAPLGALCAQRSRVAAVGPTRDTVAPGRHRLLSRCPQARNPERGRPSPPGAPGSRSCSLLSAHATSSEVTRRRCGPSRRATAGGAAPGSGHSARRLCPVPARPPLAPDPAPGSPLGWRRAALGPREAGRPEGFRSH